VRFNPRLKHTEVLSGRYYPDLGAFLDAKGRNLNFSIISGDRLHKKAADKSSAINPAMDPSLRASAMSSRTFNREAPVEWPIR